MSGHRDSLRRLLALLGAVACAAVLLLLFDIRPSLPRLPRSLSSPITLELVHGALKLAAWGMSVALAGLLLVRSLRVFLARGPRKPLRALRPKASPAPHRPLGQARLAAGSARAEFPPPFPLILRARSEPDGQLQRGYVPAREPVAAAVGPVVGTDERSPAPARTALPHELSPPSIALLGPLEIAVSKPDPRGLRSRTQQLLAYLALHADGATTDELVTVLSPDVDDDRARKRLWRSVSEARSRLGEIILHPSERYLLDRQAVAVDLDQFEHLLTRASAEPGADRKELLERARARVRGQPLAGTDYPWAAGDVRRLRATIVDLLADLGSLRLDDSNATGALAAAEDALALDAYNEAAHQLAMRAEAVLGLRQAIVDRYEQLCQELDDRFGLEPGRETRLLYRRLLSQGGEEP
jgi:DNA-binding SARP family transcriptional activator